MVESLKERGAGKITIGEGTVVMDPKGTRTAVHAFKTPVYENATASESSTSLYDEADALPPAAANRL